MDCMCVFTSRMFSTKQHVALACTFFSFVFLLTIFIYLFFLFFLAVSRCVLFYFSFSHIILSLLGVLFARLYVVVCPQKYVFDVAISQTIKTIIKRILNYFVATRQNLQNIQYCCYCHQFVRDSNVHSHFFFVNH